jgi:hypothetical protein
MGGSARFNYSPIVKYCLVLIFLFAEEIYSRIKLPYFTSEAGKTHTKKKKEKIEVISGDVKQHGKRKGTNSINEKMQKSK